MEFTINPFTNRLDAVNLAIAPAGTIIQIATNSTAAYTALSGFNIDDTVPINTDGTEILTLTITPTSAFNILNISFTGWQGNSSISVAALFQDANPNSLCTTYNGANMILNYNMVAGTNSATTFKIRAGGNILGPTAYLNGVLANRLFGGTGIATLTVTEYTV